MPDATSPAPAPDADLMRRTAAGDREAFAALYRRHQGVIFRFARLMTGCTTAAEDVVQEVFLALMRDASRYDPSRASLATYLYGIARHQTRRRLLRDRRFVAFDRTGPDAQQAAGHPIDSELSHRGELERLRRAILSLPSRYREVVVLCDLQDVKYGDAATMLGCPVGTIRSRLHRARHLLADKLGRPENGRAASSLDHRPRMRCAV